MISKKDSIYVNNMLNSLTNDQFQVIINILSILDEVNNGGLRGAEYTREWNFEELNIKLMYSKNNLYKKKNKDKNDKARKK